MGCLAFGGLLALLKGLEDANRKPVQYCVRPTMEAQRSAAQRLVNPLPFALLAEKFGCASGLGRYMAERFEAGRFRYVSDPKNCDYWSEPLATVTRGTGDCEDWSIVAASVLRAVGLPQLNLVLGRSDGEGHAWVEGVDRHGWFLLEATNGAVYRHRPSGYVPNQLVIV